MRNASVWARLLGLANTVVEDVDFDAADDAVVVSVRPRKRARQRCGRCGRRAGWYDRGEGRRRWRTLDLGQLRCYLEADMPRVACPDHGPTVIQVPWARHGAGHTRGFDDQVAWLATHTSKLAVTALMRIAWRTVGAIVARVVADARAATDPFAGLSRIAIDEISYKRGHLYLMVVIDHDTGRLVWAAPGHNKRTLAGFFTLLGTDRCAQIRLVSLDAAPWIADVVRLRCPNATLCVDAFHVVSWATRALDAVRADAMRAARRTPGGKTLGTRLHRARWALWRNPEDLTDRQTSTLQWLQETNQPIYRAYLLKEQLRAVFEPKGDPGVALLDAWIPAAAHCGLEPFEKLARQVAANRDGIAASLTHNLSNAIAESTNTKIRLLTRVAFGFKDPHALIALALLDRGGYCPPLPGRAA